MAVVCVTRSLGRARAAPPRLAVLSRSVWTSFPRPRPGTAAAACKKIKPMELFLFHTWSNNKITNCTSVDFIKFYRLISLNSNVAIIHCYIILTIEFKSCSIAGICMLFNELM